MDPRQLLDPKGFAREKSKKRIPKYGPQQSRKPQTSEQANSIPTPPTIDPKVLLSPKAAFRESVTNGSSVADALGPANDDRSVTAEAEDGSTQLGMGTFIERMHHVTNREDVAMRKRKSDLNDDGEDDDITRKKAKSTFHGATNGTIISEHMKEMREKNAAEHGPQDAVIDLSNENDKETVNEDDVQFVGAIAKAKANLNEEICLGAFHGKANIHRIPVVGQAAANIIGKDYWPRMRLSHRREAAQNVVVNLYDRGQNHVGNLNPQLGNVLCPLLDCNESVKFKIKVWLESRLRREKEVPGLRVSQYHTVSILVYSKRQYAEAIGKHLAKSSVFLTAPTVNPGAEFDNPQMPKAYGQQGRNGERRPQTSQSTSYASRTAEEMRREADTMFDKMVRHEDLREKDADPSYIVTQLLPHQKQALNFLTEHERIDQTSTEGDVDVFLWKLRVLPNGRQLWYNVITGHEVYEKPTAVQGGILADMMGLGKTLSILSLVAETRREARAFGDTEPSAQMSGVERNAKGTLIVCPKSVMSNWQEQVQNHAVPNKFKVYCYHGSNRTQDLDKLASYDIILTTYNTAGAEFNVKDKALSAIQWFRVVLDEAHQIRNSSTQVSKACCALLAQRRWAVTGTPVQNGLNDLGALIRFLRIKPFDEGSNWAQYIMAPFKNANPEVLVHLQLLVQSITLRRLKDKVGLGGRFEEMVRIAFSNEERKRYEKVAGDSLIKLKAMTGGAGKLRGKSYAHVLKSIGQMRMFCVHNLDMFGEEDRKEVLEGMNEENAIAIDLGDEPGDEPDEKFITEKQAYEALHMMSDSDVDRCIKCNRKIGDNVDDLNGAVDLTEDEDSDSDDVSERYDTGNGDSIGYITPCYHLICTKCKDKHITEVGPTLTADKRHTCQHCEAYVRFGLYEFLRSKLRDYIEGRNATTARPKGRKWDETSYSGPSSKVQALISDLKLSAIETETLPPDEPPIRSIVFSGWTNFLDLIEVALEDNDINFVRLDGTMSVRARTTVLERFKSDPSVTVMLVSIKAGGQGLNLTSANKVYMMEPQFNPAAEQQAIERVHRLGQTRDVHIRHYIMTDSVEERILKLQEKKEKLAKLSMEKNRMNRQEEAKKRIEELKDLFNK